MLQADQPEDFLTPQQRAEAIAEILATIALRMLKKRHEQQDSNNYNL